MKAVRSWIQKADDAMKRAAKRAREVAAQTNTAVVVQKDGRIIKLRPGQDGTGQSSGE
jgi:hypothetical protein